MPANNPKPAATTPASPRSTAKYTNKDGSKFITVPKESHSDSSLPPTPTGAKASDSPASEVIALENAPRTINRKKQKRRQKAAAKAAAVETNGNDHEDLASAEHRTESPYPGREVLGSDDDLEYVLASEQSVPSVNGQTNTTSKSKKNKKKKKKNIGNESSGVDAPSHPTLPQGARSGMSRDKIWSNSNHEERERIKDFWLGLGEEERKSLVKVEKDAVLRKMKEQQKHTCSCTVCGRKRNAIEEELEGLYDAYYLELEQFANQGEGPLMLPPPRDFPLRPARGIPSGYTAPPPTRGRLVEQIGDEDEDDLEEVYSEDEVDDDEFSDDEPPESYHNSHDRDVADFLTFGNSLQVKGGILTVADDLLKNDGKRFIEMMEQLAERRMAREEDAREHFSRGYGHPDGSYSNSHNHPPPEEDEYDEEEDEEDDYDDSQDEEYEDEEDQMTEEQRMEEGRRMFQIFAARMFEQRVLSAYKEKVAKERQQKLLEELEEESRQVDEQKAKKAKSAQKKKDKAAQRKQALAEEKARKEAEKAAEEAARLEAEQKRVAEQKQKAEEKRKQREAQKKAEEDARLRKEAERLRKLHEQKERQAEQERKARESKEREKKLKEEQRQKEKEVRDQKEREAHERREKQERDKREKEARAVKAQKDALEATEAKVKAKEEKNVQKPAASQISIPPGQRASHTSTALPQHLPTPLSYASPKIPIATPAVNKVPTPIRHRATSQQDQMRSSSTTSQSAIGVSPNPSPHSSTPIHTSPGNIGQERKTSLGTISSGLLSSQSVSPPGLPTVLPNQAPPFHMPAMVSSGHLHHPPPGFQNRLPQDQMYPVPFRPNPNIMMGPPGINGQTIRGLPPGPMAPPGFSHGASDPFPLAQGFAIPKDVPQPTHARHGSGSFEVNGSVGLPIGRPAPIGRPSNNAQGSTRHEDSETKPLGSSALVADDEPLTGDLGTNSYRGPPPGLPRGGFGTSPFMDNGFPMVPGPWGAPAGAQQFAPASFGSTGWGGPSVPPGFGVTSPAPSLNPLRTASQPRHIAVRLMLCQACKDLSNAGNADVEGFMGLGAIKSQIDMHSGDPTITEQDLLNLCDTEGNGSNGGGTFDVRGSPDTGGKPVIRWVPDGNDGHVPQYRAVGAPGEIGSPLTGFTSMRGI